MAKELLNKHWVVNLNTTICFNYNVNKNCYLLILPKLVFTDVWRFLSDCTHLSPICFYSVYSYIRSDYLTQRANYYYSVLKVGVLKIPFTLVHSFKISLKNQDYKNQSAKNMYL